MTSSVPLGRAANQACSVCTLSPPIAAPLPGVMPPVEGGLDAVAVATMRQALADCGGNVSRAARVLGISRSTLYRRLGLGG